MFKFRKRHESEHVTPETDTTPDGEDRRASGVEALNTLKQFEKMHHLDPNLPIEELNDVDAALNDGNAEKGLEVEQALVEDNSPYPEVSPPSLAPARRRAQQRQVRATVRNFDVDFPANTIRAWFIGLLLCTIGSAVNMLFSMRNPSILVTTYVIQLVAYPIGLGWDLIMPDHDFHLLGLSFNLKPGKFNYKEHVIIVVMSNVSRLRPLPRCTPLTCRRRRTAEAPSTPRTS